MQQSIKFFLQFEFRYFGLSGLNAQLQLVTVHSIQINQNTETQTAEKTWPS